MTCGRRWIEEPRLFDRKSDDFPSQSLLTSGLDGRPSSSLHCLPRVHHPPADANAPVCAAGATTPEPDPGVEGREEGLDLPGGQIGVSLLTGAKFGDRMKKIFPEFFVLDFMRTEKFREHIV